MKFVIEFTKKNMILLCAGLILVATIAILEPFLLIGIVAGFGAGSFCMKRYPTRYPAFRFPESRDKARIKELEKEVEDLKKEVKK